jgi:hypothetical protein
VNALYGCGYRELQMPAKTSPQSSGSVYLLQHVAREGTDDEDVKVLGIYSSPRKAEIAIEKFKQLPGFDRYPDSFHIDKYELDKLEWSEGFVTR